MHNRIFLFLFFKGFLNCEILLYVLPSAYMYRDVKRVDPSRPELQRIHLLACHGGSGPRGLRSPKGRPKPVPPIAHFFAGCPAGRRVMQCIRWFLTMQAASERFLMLHAAPRPSGCSPTHSISHNKYTWSIYYSNSSKFVIYCSFDISYWSQFVPDEMISIQFQSSNNSQSVAETESS